MLAHLLGAGEEFWLTLAWGLQAAFGPVMEFS
jgi:hypothetical protein